MLVGVRERSTNTRHEILVTVNSAGWTCLALCHIEARAVFSLITGNWAIGESDQVQEVAGSHFTECLIFCSGSKCSIPFFAGGASDKAPPLTVGTNAASNGGLGLGIPTCNAGTAAKGATSAIVSAHLMSIVTDSIVKPVRAAQQIPPALPIHLKSFILTQWSVDRTGVHYQCMPCSLASASSNGKLCIVM